MELMEDLLIIVQWLCNKWINIIQKIIINEITMIFLCVLLIVIYHNYILRKFVEFHNYLTAVIFRFTYKWIDCHAFADSGWTIVDETSPYNITIDTAPEYSMVTPIGDDRSIEGILEDIGYIINTVGNDDDPAWTSPEDVCHEQRRYPTGLPMQNLSQARHKGLYFSSYPCWKTWRDAEILYS